MADHGGAFGPDHGTFRCHRASSVEGSDSIQDIHEHAAVGPDRVVLSSWDYVRLDTRTVVYQADREADDG